MSYSKRVNQVLILLGLLLALLPCITWAQVDSIPVSSQKSFLLPSKILSEERTVWIHTPADYPSSKETYPVVYLLDGEGHFNYVSQMVEYLSGYDRNRIPKIIVVGIVNVDRSRDLTPVLDSVSSPRRKEVLSSVGAGRFLRFIEEELVPYIDKNYPTQPYRILAGHSLGGLFALYAKQTVPHLFQSTILMSPAINLGPAQVRSDFAAFLRREKDLAGKMFISLGNENRQHIDTLLQQLKAYAPLHGTSGIMKMKIIFRLPIKVSLMA